MTFRVGQKVVCVDDKFSPVVTISVPSLPRKGRIYTVRDLWMHPCGETIKVEEIINPPCILDFDDGILIEPFWPSCRFRPVIDRPTDISIFTVMLDPVRIREFSDAGS